MRSSLFHWKNWNVPHIKQKLCKVFEIAVTEIITDGKPLEPEIIHTKYYSIKWKTLF